MRVHPIFYVSLLQPYTASCILGKFQLLPPPVKVNGNEEYKIKEILDYNLFCRKLFYLIHCVVMLLAIDHGNQVLI